jgi:hypothetical protein
MKDYEIIEYLFWRIVILLLLSPFIFFGLIIILMILLHTYWFGETFWGQITYPSIDYLVQNYENKNDVFEIVAQEAIQDCEKYGLKRFYSEPQWGKQAFFYGSTSHLPYKETLNYTQSLVYLDVEDFFVDENCKSVSLFVGIKFDNYRHEYEDHYRYTRKYFYSTEIPESNCASEFKNISHISDEYGLIPDLNKFKPDCDRNYHLYQKLDEDWYLYDGRYKTIVPN